MQRQDGLCICIALTSALVSRAQPLPPFHDLGRLAGDASIVPSTNSQQDHDAARGGNQTLVAWTDYRARSGGGQTVQSDGDIFGVRLNDLGEPIDATPFLIAGGMGLQQRPALAWNGENWLVLYTSQDPVGGYYEHRLRAVRVSPLGQVLDPIPILFPPAQFTPDTIGMNLAGQNGQWLITRCVYHADGYGTYLAGERIGGDGHLLDESPVVLMDWIYGATTCLSGNGEYLVAGPTWNDSTTFQARRVGLNGVPNGAAFNVPSLNIASSDDEYYVVWIAGYTNLVGSRMTGAGTLLTPAGTVLVSNFSQYHQSAVAGDGTTWWVEWGAADQLHLLRVSAAGLPLDPDGGALLPITIGGSINQAYSPMLAPRGAGGISLFWYDLRASLGADANVFALPISAENVAGVERCLSTGTPSQRNPDFSDGPGGGVAIAYVSEGANNDRVLVSFLSPSGAPLGGEPIEVFQGPTVGVAGIAFNGEQFMVTWDQGSSGLSPTQVMARRLNPDGTFLDEQPILVMPGFNPAIEALGTNFLIAAARFATYPQFIYLYGNRIDGLTGTVLDGPAGLFLGGGYVNGKVRVRSDGAQWWVAAHSMWTHDSSQGDAILARVPPVGPATQAFNPTPVAGGSGDPDLAFSGEKYLIVWRMNSLSNANNYIAGRVMNADGSFPPGYFTIAEAAGRQLRPTVSWDGDTFVVGWDDQRNQSSFFDARTDVYAARVTEQGTVLDLNAIPIATNPEADSAVATFSHADGATLFAYSNFDLSPPFDSYRIRLARFGLPAQPGDLNCDGLILISDIGPFVLALTDPAGYAAQFPNCGNLNGDINGDGLVSVGDIGPFVALLSG